MPGRERQLRMAFLGKTHEIVALERDPDGEIDYQTRIDADVLAWLSSHGLQR